MGGVNLKLAPKCYLASLKLTPRASHPNRSQKEHKIVAMTDLDPWSNDDARVEPKRQLWRIAVGERRKKYPLRSTVGHGWSRKDKKDP